MIDHIIVDKLRPNDLAIYDVDQQDCDIVYNLKRKVQTIVDIPERVVIVPNMIH